MAMSQATGLPSAHVNPSDLRPWIDLSRPCWSDQGLVSDRCSSAQASATGQGGIPAHGRVPSCACSHLRYPSIPTDLASLATASCATSQIHAHFFLLSPSPCSSGLHFLTATGPCGTSKPADTPAEPGRPAILRWWEGSGQTPPNDSSRSPAPPGVRGHCAPPPRSPCSASRPPPPLRPRAGGRCCRRYDREDRGRGDARSRTRPRQGWSIGVGDRRE